MIVTVVSVYVNENFIDEFIAASTENHNGSINEDGNLRFDVLQSIDNPCEFTLYEAYDSEESAKLHKETPHYKKWRDTVAEMMEKPRSGKAHKVIVPTSSKEW